MAESEEELESRKRRKWEKLLKKKTKIMASGPITSNKENGRKWKLWQILFSWAPESLRMVTVAMKLKDTCSLEGKLWQTQTVY